MRACLGMLTVVIVMLTVLFVYRDALNKQATVVIK